jgi:hypothetical protein
VIPEGKALVSAAQQVGKVKEWVEVSTKVRDQLNRSIEQANLEAIQVCYAVCKAFVAHAIGVEPSTDQVNEYMAKAVDDPAFPNRAYRLFGEAQKSASHRRRAFLAAMLFGLPFTKIPEDERDRVDMAVERMTVPDVEFLLIVSEKRRMSPDLTEGQLYLFGPSGVGAMLDGTSLRIVTPDLWRNQEFSAELFEDSRFIGDRAALASLVSVGCLDVGQVVLNSGRGGKVHHLIILPLGEMVLRALEEVRPGLGAQV